MEISLFYYSAEWTNYVSYWVPYVVDWAHIKRHKIESAYLMTENDTPSGMSNGADVKLLFGAIEPWSVLYKYLYASAPTVKAFFNRVVFRRLSCLTHVICLFVVNSALFLLPFWLSTEYCYQRLFTLVTFTGRLYYLCTEFLQIWLIQLPIFSVYIRR